MTRLPINRLKLIQNDSGEIVGREYLKYSGLMNLNSILERYLSKRLTRNRVLNSKMFQIDNFEMKLFRIGSIYKVS